MVVKLQGEEKTAVIKRLLKTSTVKQCNVFNADTDCLAMLMLCIIEDKD